MLFLGLGSLLICVLSILGVGAQAVTRRVVFWLIRLTYDDCCCWLFFLCSFVSLVSVLGTTELITVHLRTRCFSFIDFLYTAWFLSPRVFLFRCLFVVWVLFFPVGQMACLGSAFVLKVLSFLVLSGFLVWVLGSVGLAVWLRFAFPLAPPPLPLPPLLLPACAVRLASHLLHLGTQHDGALSPAMAPAPSGPPPRASVLTCLLLGDDGWTRGGVGRKGDRGHCDPAHDSMANNYDRATMAVPRPLRNPAVSPELGFVGGYLFHHHLGLGVAPGRCNLSWALVVSFFLCACSLPIGSCISSTYEWGGVKGNFFWTKFSS